MAIMNPKIDNYLAVGCGRCPLGGTPDCKVHAWQAEMKQLRRILLDTPLTEQLKWSFPCYTYQNSNIVMMAAFKDNCTVSFFKGVLLKDPDNVLVAQGANSQAVRVIRFTTVEAILALELTLKAYIAEAIEIEKAGLKVPYKDTSAFDVPDELLASFEDDPSFAAAFAALTPGRQRGYLLHFASAKQSPTRARRIKKYMAQIFEGKGLHDR